MRKLKNSTASNITHSFSGYVFEPDVAVDIPLVDVDNMIDSEMETYINNGDIVVINEEDEELDPKIGWSYFSTRSKTISASLAVDKDGTDQAISGTGWTVVEAERILWDLNGDYDISVDDFVVPENAIYTLDPVIRIKDIVDVEEIELAIFKRGSPDDYWFLLDRKYPASQSLSEVVLSNSVAFDMYMGERFCLKVKMIATSGGTPTANIDGSDDYTAWGYDLSKKL